MASDDDALPGNLTCEWSTPGRTVRVGDFLGEIYVSLDDLPALIRRLQELVDETQTLEPGTDGDGT